MLAAAFTNSVTVNYSFTFAPPWVTIALSVAALLSLGILLLVVLRVRRK